MQVKITLRNPSLFSLHDLIQCFPYPSIAVTIYMHDDLINLLGLQRDIAISGIPMEICSPFPQSKCKTSHVIEELVSDIFNDITSLTALGQLQVVERI